MGIEMVYLCKSLKERHRMFDLFLECYPDRIRKVDNVGYSFILDDIKDTYDGCEHCRGRAYTEELFEVVTQLGAHVKTQFNFCPNCGRNMKGETK